MYKGAYLDDENIFYKRKGFFLAIILQGGTTFFGFTCQKFANNVWSVVKLHTKITVQGLETVLRRNKS